LRAVLSASAPVSSSSASDAPIALFFAARVSSVALSLISPNCAASSFPLITPIDFMSVSASGEAMPEASKSFPTTGSVARSPRSSFFPDVSNSAPDRREVRSDLMPSASFTRIRFRMVSAKVSASSSVFRPKSSAGRETVPAAAGSCWIVAFSLSIITPPQWFRGSDPEKRRGDDENYNLGGSGVFLTALQTGRDRSLPPSGHPSLWDSPLQILWLKAGENAKVLKEFPEYVSVIHKKLIEIRYLNPKV